MSWLSAQSIKPCVMKPEVILQSDLLDIIFESRNKEYGAYALRKTYDRRLLQAIAGTCLLVLLFVLLQSLRPAEGPIVPPDPGELFVREFTIPAEPEEEKPREVPKAKRKTAMENATAPVITAAPVDKPLATQEQLGKANLGSKTLVGDPPLPGEPGPGDGPGTAPVTDPDPVVTPPEEIKTPLDFAEVMPSFKGDIRQYLMRHLREPNDLEPGERIVVRVKFVVARDGSISDIEIVQSGRRDLDAEVIRVVKKMPHWNPGRQGERFVPVYFQLPVTFIGYAE